ncbi:hypothetical protein [Streptomyces sp. NPDC037389]|uniref:hypothetical protein n=1 Tax=Streptomyces sp. NPDC037389 TaxID=3155369 RepID=UPI0033FBB226
MPEPDLAVRPRLFPGLPAAPPVPHTSGPLAWPTREECGVCARYRSAVGQAEVHGHSGHAASYRSAWARHCVEIPHKGPAAASA